MAATALIALVVAPAGAQDSTTDDGEKAVLKIGWAQDPATLNPFTEVNEEGFNVWATNWDLLVNFSPDDLKPTEGIAESWEVSEDQKTVTFTLNPDAKWSDGTPITSTDVKWSLENLGTDGYNFVGLHRQGQVDRDPRRHHGRHQHHPARRPHGRRPLRLHPPRAHLGQGAAGRADRHLPARAAAGRQRAVHRHRVRAQPDHPHGAEPRVARRGARTSTRSSTSSTAPRTRPSAR